MDKTWVFVTMLTGLSSFGVALIAWLQASRTAKLNAKASLDLEKFRTEAANRAALELEKIKAAHQVALETIKAEILSGVEKRRADAEQRLKAYEKAAEEVSEIESALVRFWQILQRIKEIVSIFGEAKDTQGQVQEVHRLASDFCDCYGRDGGKLSDELQGALHCGKAEVTFVAMNLSAMAKIRGGSEEALQKHRQCMETLLNQRERLTVIQKLITEARNARRSQRMRELLAMWNTAGDSGIMPQTNRTGAPLACET